MKSACTSALLSAGNGWVWRAGRDAGSANILTHSSFSAARCLTGSFTQKVIFDDVINGSAGGLDVVADVGKHIGNLLLQRRRQLACARVRSANHARHDDIAYAASVGDRILMTCT